MNTGLMGDLPEVVKGIVENGDVMEAFSAYWAQTESYLRTLPSGHETIMATNIPTLASNLLVADELRKIRVLLEEIEDVC